MLDFLSITTKEILCRQREARGYELPPLVENDKYPPPCFRHSPTRKASKYLLVGVPKGEAGASTLCVHTYIHPPPPLEACPFILHA